MHLAVIAPEYFPGPATAAIMASADVVLVADTFLYARQSHQNRACIRTPGGRQWITIPVGHGQHGRSIVRTRIRDVNHWRAKHLKALRFNYGASPYFEHYIMRIESLLLSSGPSLADVTVASTRFVADQLGARPQWLRASELEGAPGDLPSILEVAGPGTLLLPESSPDARVPPDRRVARFRFAPPEYRQQFDGFVRGCSALDMLMLHGPASRDLLLTATRID